MSQGPPFNTTRNRDDWEKGTRKLNNYPDRDIRILFPVQYRGSERYFGYHYSDQSGYELGPHYQPADFGDFDPNPDDPDPEVWPLKELDPGYPTPARELILVSGSFPAPHVAWVTEDYLEARYGYNPVKQTLAPEDIPVWARPEDTNKTDFVDVVATNESSGHMELTDDRVEALTRIARLWNGEEVQGHHLLLDKLPNWMDILGDLNQDGLRRLVVDPTIDEAFAEKFADHEWYQMEKNVYLRPQYILRKKVWYAPTQRGRTLINKHSDFPSLIGDLNEGLPHRTAVGLSSVREVQLGRNVETYYENDDYIIDIVSVDSGEQIYVGEVMTGHHNWKLHQRTYKKMKELNSQGIRTYAVFDSRETAYKIFNHWIKKGLGDLPGGTFDSEFRLDKGREKIHNAYESDIHNWAISDWTTTSALWRETLGQDSPQISPAKVKSLSW